MQAGDYWSWTIVNEEVVVKHCDLSSYKHNLCKTVKPIRAYWGIKDGQPKNIWDVKMNYDGLQENAQIEVLDSGQGRLRFSHSMKEF